MQRFLEKYVVPRQAQGVLQLSFKQTTLKKFVIPLLISIIVQNGFITTTNDQDAFSQFILQISLKQDYPESLSMKRGHKSADWFIKNSKKGFAKDLQRNFNTKLMNRGIGLSCRYYPNGVNIAIDITKIPVYTKKTSKYLTKANSEKGTTQFYQFLGFSITEKQFKFPLSFHLLEKGELKDIHLLIEDFLGQLANRLKVNLILLDRGFISSKIVKILQEFKIPYIIAFRKSQKLNKVFNALDSPRLETKEKFYSKAINNYVHRVNEKCWVINDYCYGKDEIKTNLIIWRIKVRKSKSKKNNNQKYEYFVYIADSSVNPEDVYYLYGTRWRIETAFRQIKSLQAKTRVIDPSHRIWLFGVASLLYASWVVRHLPKEPELILPEILESEEDKKSYQLWIYSRIPVRELVEQYLNILNIN